MLCTEGDPWRVTPPSQFRAAGGAVTHFFEFEVG
jgi:hypothetical protein